MKYGDYWRKRVQKGGYFLDLQEMYVLEIEVCSWYFSVVLGMRMLDLVLSNIKIEDLIRVVYLVFKKVWFMV